MNDTINQVGAGAPANCLREALVGLLAVVDDSQGVAGYHLNGAIAEWGEFPEVGAARATLADLPECGCCGRAGECDAGCDARLAAPAAPVAHDPYAGCERECGGVGAICWCRVDEAAERERLQREVAAPELWAVHAQGPDDLYPAFSREDAEQHAAALNSLSIPGIQVAAVVVPSPWAEAEHWRYLAEQEREHKQELSAAVKHALAEYRAALAGKGGAQ